MTRIEGHEIYLVDPLMDYEDCYQSLNDLLATGLLKDGDEIILMSDKPIDGDGKRSCKMYEWCSAEGLK